MPTSKISEMAQSSLQNLHASFTLTLLILIKMVPPQQQMPFNSFVLLFFLEADAQYSNNCVFLSIPWEVCRFQLCCGLRRFLRTKVWNQITMFNIASPGKRSEFHTAPKKWTLEHESFITRRLSVSHTSHRFSLVTQSWKLLACSMPQNTQWTIKQAGKHGIAAKHVVQTLLEQEADRAQDPATQYAEPIGSLDTPWFLNGHVWFFKMYYIPLHVEEPYISHSTYRFWKPHGQKHWSWKRCPREQGRDTEIILELKPTC